MSRPSKTEVFLSWSDFSALFYESRKTFLAICLSLGLLMAYFTLSRPVAYEVEASFLEKGKTDSGMNNSLFKVFSGSPEKNHTVTLMESQKVLELLVDKMQLQATVSEIKSRRGLIGTMWDNVKVQWAHFSRRQTLLFPDVDEPLACSKVLFKGEEPLSWLLKFNSNEDFVVIDKKNKEIGKGRVDEVFTKEATSFCLAYKDKNKKKLNNLKGKQFAISFTPREALIKGLSKGIITEADEDNSNLVNIVYTHPDRHFATKLVNNLMFCYQQYLKEDLAREHNFQLDYLQQRKDETKKSLQALLLAHADSQLLDISQCGFIDSEKQMSFFIQNQMKCKEKVIALDLELNRLKSLKETKETVYFDQFTLTGDPSFINTSIAKIQDLKQQREALSLSVQEELVTSDEVEQAFSNQVERLAEVQESLREVTEIVDALENDLEIASDEVQLFKNPNLLVKKWYEDLRITYVNREFSNESKELSENNLIGKDKVKKERWLKKKQNFLDYLKNLQKTFEMHEGIIQDRLAYQQNPMKEFQGVNLQTASSLYLQYNNLLDQTEEGILETEFILKKITQPEFDLSSLSSSAKDPVSADIINRSFQLVLKKRDESYRSAKEQERLDEELLKQRSFLQSHLTQNNEVLALRKHQLKQKISSLRNVSLDLIYQQIAFLEKGLSSYVVTRIGSLNQEKGLIESHLTKIENEMGKVPKKWVSEQLIKHQLEVNQRVVNEVTQLVESKNISHNLEMIQSIPLNFAYPPVLPNSPRLLLKMGLGIFLGIFIGIAWVITQALKSGVRASSENLTLLGEHISGKLTGKLKGKKNEIVLDSDLQSLRRFVGYLCEDVKESSLPMNPLGRRVLLVGNSQHNYAPALLGLLSKRGWKSIIITISFLEFATDEGSDGKEKGLLQYLEGNDRQLNCPKIINKGFYDEILAGGVSRYAGELVGSFAFKELLEKLKGEYDWIFLKSTTELTNADSEIAFNLVDYAAVVVKEEKVEELSTFTRVNEEVSRDWENKEEGGIKGVNNLKKVSYLFENSNFVDN